MALHSNPCVHAKFRNVEHFNLSKFSGVSNSSERHKRPVFHPCFVLHNVIFCLVWELHHFETPDPLAHGQTSYIWRYQYWLPHRPCCVPLTKSRHTLGAMVRLSRCCSSSPSWAAHSRKPYLFSLYCKMQCCLLDSALVEPSWCVYITSVQSRFYSFSLSWFMAAQLAVHFWTLCSFLPLCAFLLYCYITVLENGGFFFF